MLYTSYRICNRNISYFMFMFINFVFAANVFWATNLILDTFKRTLYFLNHNASTRCCSLGRILNIVQSLFLYTLNTKVLYKCKDLTAHSHFDAMKILAHHVVYLSYLPIPQNSYLRKLYEQHIIKTANFAETHINY